jgi:hypothetical protein|tara:strand:- start:233 stop:535 length:303 start_codon:yes stop_codon:yes gene_type:complete
LARLEKGNPVKEIISFQIHRNITNLYKKYFEISEDLLEEHKLFIARLKSLNDSSKVDLIDYFTEEKYNNIRKKILDAGNDSIREIEKALEFVDIKIKEDE